MEVASFVNVTKVRQEKVGKIFIVFIAIKTMEFSDGFEKKDKGQIHNEEVSVKWGIKKSSIATLSRTWDGATAEAEGWQLEGDAG